jgi:hypothetical protein
MSTTALIIHIRAAVASAQLDWINWKIRFDISWSCLKPGRLITLNPNLLH